MNYRLLGVLTRLQISQKMAEVQRIAERARERERLRRQLIEGIREDLAALTGHCHDCGREVGPRQLFCRKHRQSHTV